MYDLRQFRPTLYLVLLMGVSGFSLAAQTPGLWLVAVGGILLNGWLVKQGRYAPMPRLVANLVTIVALLFVLFQMRADNATPIITIGEFLVLLHLVKLFEQRANRDYAQLLVLSLLLMIAGAISTYSLLFAIIFFLYLLASLYCCLLFHLKVEADHAQKVIGMPEANVNPATLRQDQKYLPRSMRKLTALVAVVSLATAVLVFLFFPRGAGVGLLGAQQFHLSQTVTGFSEQVGYQDIAKITQDDAVVARLTVVKNGLPLKGTEPIQLRALALDRYVGSDESSGGPWQWVRSSRPPFEFAGRRHAGGEPPPSREEPRDINVIRSLNSLDPPTRYIQQIHLEPLGDTRVFAMPGVFHIIPQSDVRFRHSEQDWSIQSIELLRGPIDYTAISTGIVPLNNPRTQSLPGETEPTDRQRWFLQTLRLTAQAPYGSQIDPRIVQFARRPEVCGVNAATGRPLADLLAPDWRNRGPADFQIEEKIAANFESYLRSHFTYTLDLTDLARVQGRDPLVAFLYDFKKGHCQYFAGAMTLMCQSLFIPARVVVGFRSDEYNGVGGYYVVRRSHAHAWVEVLTGTGWIAFDPTSGTEAESSQQYGFFAATRHFFDYLDYRWATSVVAYDRGDREGLIDRLNLWMSRRAISGSADLSARTRQISRWWDQARWSLPKEIIGGLILLMLAAMVGLIGWFLWEKRLLRRRARHIGLTSLPASAQARLARQLGFYDDLLRLLEKRNIRRPPHLTPMEFCQTLTFLPSGVYDNVRRLTRVFYKIRFGAAELSPRLQRRLAAVIAQIESAMTPPPKDAR